MRCIKLDLVSPHGQRVTIEASQGGHLIIARESPDAAFIDIRDDRLPKHADGFERLVAQVPSSWLVLPKWSDVPTGCQEARAAFDPPPLDGLAGY